VGAAVAVRRWRGWPLAAAVVAGEAVYALLLNQVEPVITPFLPVTGLFLAALAGAGVVAVRRLAGGGSGIVTAAVVILSAVLVASIPAFRDRDLPCAADSYAQLRTQRLLAAVPPGSIAVVSGDATAFPLVYLQGVGAARPELTILDRTNSVFRYPGWSPAKIDGEARRGIEDRLLGEGRPVIILGSLQPGTFGSRTEGSPASIVAVSGAPRPAMLPDPFGLIGMPAGGMTTRTVAEGAFLALREAPFTRREAVSVLRRIARWGVDDPYLLNEAAARLFEAGDRRGAEATLALGATRFPDVPALRRNLESLRAMRGDDALPPVR
jgi:hypothetical protein